MSDEMTAVVLKELRAFRTETNSRFNGLETQVVTLQQEIGELHKKTDEHTVAIQELRETTKENTERIIALEETTKELRNETNELKRATQENTKRIVGLEKATQENTKRIVGLEKATQENTKRIVGLEKATKENTERIIALEGTTKELKKATEENTEGIMRLEKGRKEDRLGVIEILQTMDKSITESFSEIKNYMDINFEKIHASELARDIQYKEITKELKLQKMTLNLHGIKIKELENWKDRFEKGTLSFV